MFGFVANILSDALAPLMESIADFSARLLRKVALFLVAALCMVVVLIALTAAFDLWIASLAGPIVAALAVAALYLAIAVLAIVFALRDEPSHAEAGAVAGRPDEAKAAAAMAPELNAQIDQLMAPVLDILQRFGLRREQLAVFAGANLAKRLGPVPLVGCAIIVGFLVGRLWKSWRHLLEAGLAASPFIMDILGQKPVAPAEPPAA